MCDLCGRLIEVTPASINFGYGGPNKLYVKAAIERRFLKIENRQAEIKLAREELLKLRHLDIQR